MRYNLIIIGLIFLFNPEINIIDFLPDFIGIILIMKGILPVIQLSPTIEDSYSYFKKYLFTSLIKFFAIIPLFSVASSDPAFYTLFTFSFALISIIFLLPAFKQLFSGIYYLAYHRDAKIKNISALSVFFSIFFVLKYTFSVLPELVYLYVVDDNLYEFTIYPLAPYKGAIVLICFTVALILGIIWLIIAEKGFSKLKRNSIFNISLLRDISNIQHTVSDHVTKSFSKIYPLICLTSVFFIPIYIDGINFLPTFVPSLLIYFSIKASKKLITVFSKKLITASKLSILFSFVSFAISIAFNSRYHDIAILNFKRVQIKYIIPSIAYLVATIFFILAFVSLYKVLKSIIYEHTGNYWEAPYLSHNSVAAKEKTKLQFKLKLCFIFGVMLAISNCLAYILLYYFPLYLIFSFVAAILFVFYITSVFSNIKNAIIEKYADENSGKH